MAAPGIDSLVPLMNRDGSPTDPETLELGPDIATPVVAGTPLSAFLAMSGYAVITITALNATAPTYLTVYSGGLPTTSNLNLKPGEIVSNQVVVPVDNTGQILIANNSGSVDVIIDSVGSFSGGAKQLYSDTNANRLVDTRTNEVPTKVSTLDVVIPGANPGSAAVINLTVTDPVGAGHMLAHATGASPVPGTSNLNFAAGETRAVQVIVPVSPSGSITISTSGTTTHVVVDLIATLDNIVT